MNFDERRKKLGGERRIDSSTQMAKEGFFSSFFSFLDGKKFRQTDAKQTKGRNFFNFLRLMRSTDGLSPECFAVK